MDGIGFLCFVCFQREENELALVTVLLRALRRQLRSDVLSAASVDLQRTILSATAAKACLTLVVVHSCYRVF